MVQQRSQIFIKWISQWNNVYVKSIISKWYKNTWIVGSDIEKRGEHIRNSSEEYIRNLPGVRQLIRTNIIGFLDSIYSSRSNKEFIEKCGYIFRDYLHLIDITPMIYKNMATQYYNKSNTKQNFIPKHPHPYPEINAHNLSN